MRIGIGTQNPAKCAAVESAFCKIKEHFPTDFKEDFIFEKVSTRTSVPDMPLIQNDLLTGALERALFTYELLKTPEFTIGLEGGVYKTDNPEKAFLQSWAYVYNGKKGFYGASPAIQLPDKISKALFENGRELSEVIDSLSGEKDVRSNQGTFGILTQNMITRSKSFEMAIISAASPFFNKKFY